MPGWPARKGYVKRGPFHAHDPRVDTHTDKSRSRLRFAIAETRGLLRGPCLAERRRMRSLLAALSFASLLALAGVVATPSTARADFLFGVSVEGGGFVGPEQGAMGGVALRLGADIAGPFSLFLQSHGFVGRLTSGPNGGSAQGLLWNTLMADLHFGPFHVGVGPSVDLAWGCDQSAGCINGAPLFGLDGRVALQFDHFVLSVDVHPTFVDDDVVTGIVGGLGWQL